MRCNVTSSGAELFHVDSVSFYKDFLRANAAKLLRGMFLPRLPETHFKVGPCHNNCS